MSDVGRSIVGLLACAAGAWATFAQAAPAGPPLRVCLPDVDLPPLVYKDPRQSGLLNRLLIDAGRAAGLEVRIIRLPSVRCRLALERGDADAMPLPAIPQYLGELEFPLLQGAVDPAARVARLQFVLLRRRGEALDWDGQRLGEAAMLVGIRRGVTTLSERLQALGATLDDKAASNEQLLGKLVAGRVRLVAMSRPEYLALKASPSGQQVEALEPPLLSTDLYLAVSRQLQGPARERVPAWREQLVRLRDSPGYQLPMP